jgi:hypothetical protein
LFWRRENKEPAELELFAKLDPDIPVEAVGLGAFAGVIRIWSCDILRIDATSTISLVDILSSLKLGDFAGKTLHSAEL